MEAREGAPRRFLVLAAGDRLAAVEVGWVRKIFRALPVTPLPGARPQLLGLAQFAGEPLPVLDLAQLLGAGPGQPPRFPVTVVIWAGQDKAKELVGLAADAALDLVSITADALIPVGEGIVAAEVALPQGTAEVIDVSRLETA
ncbi:MAG: chemotaxis protein CheW [Thermoanaerobaculaceae bacterium]